MSTDRFSETPGLRLVAVAYLPSLRAALSLAEAWAYRYRALILARVDNGWKMVAFHCADDR